MADNAYTLRQFVQDLRAIAVEAAELTAIISRARPLTRRLALSKGWLQKSHYVCDPEQGFGVHLLHEEADHTLAVFAIAWLPGRGAPPTITGPGPSSQGSMGRRRTSSGSAWTTVRARAMPRSGARGPAFSAPARWCPSCPMTSTVW